VSETFTDKREKLWVFLTKLKLYIEFNKNRFRFKMNKKLFVTFFFKNAVFNWIDFKLYEFLDKSSQEKKRNREFIFSNYEKFKKELWWVFEVVDEKWATEQHIHVLWQNESAVKYLTEFQWIVTLIKWNNETLTLQYYWELKETIKDEIVQINKLKNLQRMIDVFINIDS